MVADDMVTIYGCRRKAEVPAVNAAAALAAGQLVELTCVLCSADCLGFKPMHDAALERAKVDRRELRPTCFTCVEQTTHHRVPVGTMAAMTMRAPDGAEVSIIVPGIGGDAGKGTVH